MAADGDSPPSLLGYAVAIVGVLAGVVAVLFRLSRSDKDAVILAQAEELKKAKEREEQYVKDRESAMETSIRQAQAQERTVEILKDINTRLERIEHKP